MLARPFACLGFAALLALGTASAASADPYGHYSYGYAASGYGYAGNLIEGAYVGAPFAGVPNPSRIVPPAWGYGTYGVPTVAGIREAPASRPALYIVEKRGPAVDRLAPAPRRAARIRSRGSDGRWSDVLAGPAAASGAQVVSVRVPAR